ncbi:MAG: response regulator [Rhizobacter sp.]
MAFLVGVALLIRLAYLQNTLISRSLHDAEERLALLSELEVRRAEAQHASQAKTRFLAAVSHDLRQPMHSISLLTKALARRVDADMVVHRQISASVQAMDDMLDGLLEVSKLDIGDLPLRVGPVHVPALLARLQLQFQAQAQEKGLSLTVQAAASWAYSDADELHRLLANLVSNAVRYTSQGHVLIRVRERGASLWLQVWDSGLGIARRDRLRIFDEFVQISPLKSGLAQASGTGLGLSIVQRVAQRLDHRVVVRSRPGRGSLFAVCVPRVNAPGVTDDAVLGDRALDHYLTGLLILLIEDDVAVRQSMRLLLLSFSCHVLEADSTRSALAVVDSTLRTPDLIITDYRLSDADSGLNAIVKVREAVDETIPALLITAERQPPHDAAARLGVPVLSKPLNTRALTIALSGLLGSDLASPRSTN